MKNLIAAVTLCLMLGAPARAASTYSVSTDASSTTLKLAGRFHMPNLSNVDQLVVDSVRGLFTWAYGIQASTANFTGTGNGTYSVTTSSGVSVAAGGVTAPWFSGTFYGAVSNLLGGAANSVPYQTGSGATSFLAQGTGVLYENAGAPSFVASLPTNVTITTGNVTGGFGGAGQFDKIDAAGNLTLNDGVIASTGVFRSTLTVQGNAFSVGGSAFVVSGGSVGVNTASPGAVLDVNGSARALTLNLQNIKSGTQCLHADSSGNITGTGSDCGGSANAVLTATQTFSGGNTFTAVVSFSSSVIGVTTPTFSAGNASNYSDVGSTAFGPCVTGSTASFVVTAASDVVQIGFFGNLLNTNGSSGLYALAILIDGGFVQGETTTTSFNFLQNSVGAGNYFNFNFLYPYIGLSVGAHNICVSITSLGGADGYTLKAGYKTWTTLQR